MQKQSKMLKLKSFDNSAMRVNFHNIYTLEVIKVNDWFELEFNYKEKIKKETKRIPKKFKSTNEIDKLLNPIGFRKIKGIYINMHQVCLIEKEVIPESLSDILVRFYFNSYPVLEVEIGKNSFASIESHFLVF